MKVNFRTKLVKFDNLIDYMNFRNTSDCRTEYLAGFIPLEVKEELYKVDCFSEYMQNILDADNFDLLIDLSWWSHDDLKDPLDSKEYTWCIDGLYSDGAYIKYDFMSKKLNTNINGRYDSDEYLTHRKALNIVKKGLVAVFINKEKFN